MHPEPQLKPVLLLTPFKGLCYLHPKVPKEETQSPLAESAVHPALLLQFVSWDAPAGKGEC